MSPAGLLLALALGAGPATGQEAPAAEIEKPVNLWPLVYQRRTADHFELELLFSLISYEREPRRTTLALRPLYYRQRDRAEDSLRLGVLWPLSDYKRVKDESRLWILPLFWRKANPEMSRSVLFPLFSHRRDGPKTRLGVIGYTPVTLFDFQKDRDQDTVRHRYLLWTYSRDGDRSQLSLLPFYEQARAPGLRSYSLIPLFAFYRNDADDSRRISALGFPDTWNLFEHRRRGADTREWHALLLYRRVAPQGNRLVLFPVYWDLRRGGDRAVHLWPLFSRVARGTSQEHGTVWPFFRMRSDEAEGERDLNFPWPLVRRADGPGAFDHRRAFPLFAYTANEDSPERPRLLAPGLLSPLPLAYQARGQGFSYGRFFWLAWWADTERKRTAFVLNYYSVEDKDDGWRHRGLFPLWHSSAWDDRRLDYGFPTFVSYSDPALTARTFFPLYYHYAAPATSWSAFVPLYFRYRSEPLSLRVLFPLYWHSKNDTLRSEFKYYFPLYGWYRRGATARSHYLFFPLFARFSDAETRYRSWDLLWPLVHHDQAPEGASTRVLPLYWSSRDAAGSFRIGFPLYWEFSGKASSQRHLVPVAGAYRRPDGFRFAYAGGPLYVRLSDPAARYDRRAWLAFLAGRVQDHDETRGYFFPLLWTKRSPEASRLYLLPLGGRETEGPRRTLFGLGVTPDWSLFQRSSDPSTGFAQTRALLFQSRRDAGGRSAVLFPVYWHRSGDLTGTTVLFPLYAWQTDKPRAEKELSLLGLHDGLSLCHFVRGGKEDRRLDRVLIFGRDRRGARTLKFAFPLFWHVTEPEQTRSVFFPFYHYRQNREDGQNRLGILAVTPLVSLFAWRDEPGVSSHRLWPLYGYRSGPAPGTRELGVIGVWYWAAIVHFRAEPTGLRHHLFPLYAYERQGQPAAPERTVQASLLWQVVSYRRDGPAASDFRFLWRLVKVTRRPGLSDVEVNPFWFRVEERGKGSYWAVLGGLVGRETRADGSKRTRLLWLLNL